MKKISPRLEEGIFSILRKLEKQLNKDVSIQVFVAGGIAVNYHCGERSTRDVDLFFSHRILPDWKCLVASLEDNQVLYADPNYNPTFGLLHPDFKESAVPWEGFSSDNIDLFLLSPLDVAVSKLARLSDVDRSDILALSAHFTARELTARVEEALHYYVGGTQWIKDDLDAICSALRLKESDRGPKC